MPTVDANATAADLAGKHPAAQHLALALDLDDLVAAVRLARELRPWFGTAKVGLELFSAVGPDAINAFVELGYDVLCDLKLHDIPTTVHKAARVVGSLGARYLTMHTQGGVPMLRAGVEGFKQGAADVGLPEPTPLGVTVLTSDPEVGPNVLGRRVQVALEAGCDGIVCAAAEVHEAKQYGPRLFALVPGIRPAGADTHDQGRPATPSAALAAGADLLVIGRAVVGADDPATAAAAIAEEIAG